MRRRMVIALDNASMTDRGLRPLLLVADAVNRDMDSRRLTEGIDLMVGDQLIGNDKRAVPITVKGLEAVDTNTEDVARIITALTSPRDEDPRLPLEMYLAPSSNAPRDEDPALSAHIALLVRPWALRARWVVRQAPAKDSSLSTAMTWDPISQSWSALQLTEGNSLEQVFQELVIRRWRGEADTLRRALGQSLEAHDAHPLGKHMLEVHARAAEGALRVLIADPVFGAEAIDAVDSYQQAGLRVTMADYHRRTGWRITLLAKHDPNRECEATIRGLRRLFPDVSEELGRCIYEATHRALPAVTRHLWLLADQAEPDGELLGHLSVALFTSAARRHISPQVPWSHGWHVLQKPFPQETILLSMDSLQHWTWTRRSGTRGDFIAIFPSPKNPDQEVWVVAIESKGSVGASLYDGRHQARIATDKLRERFHGANRRAERRELLRCLAEEAFRAQANPRKTHDLVAQGHLVFRAACVSTAVEGGDFQVEDEDVLWIRVQGLTGLMHLAGL